MNPIQNHEDMTTCRHDEDENGKRHIVWFGKCICGWEGDDHVDGGLYSSRPAHQDYVKHVEKELGVLAYYEAHVKCKNCGSKHSQGVPVGVHITGTTCQQCHTTMLVPDNETWDEETERTKGIWDSFR